MHFRARTHAALQINLYGQVLTLRTLAIRLDVGMACQKVCKQGRDDIIVKVNLQSPIPTSFYITVEN